VYKFGMCVAPLLMTSCCAAEAGPLSKLEWPSGGKDAACLAQLRHTPLDVMHLNITPDDFPTMVANTALGSWVRHDIGKAAYSSKILLSFSLLPTKNKGQFAQCATGQFDGYWRAIGRNLSTIAKRTVIAEPGWEANLGSKVHPWGVDRADQLQAYKACFQHASAAIRSTFKAVKISWTNSKVYKLDFSPIQMMPALSSFEHMGLMYYDSWPNRTGAPYPMTDVTWDYYVNSHESHDRGPSGIGSWLSFAKSHGKKLQVSEWGIKQVMPGETAAQMDDANYIKHMANFFRIHPHDIVLEAYQNNGTPGVDDHQLCPSTAFPKAAAAYGKYFNPTYN
jgi:hypothetical protein